MAYTNTEPTVVGTPITDDAAPSAAGYIQAEPTGAGYDVPEGDEFDRGAGSPITEFTDNETT